MDYSKIKKARLIKEIEALQEKVAELEHADTERKRAEEALQESEEKYRQLFELESDAIFLIDNETGHILEVNAGASTLYGYSRQELLQKKNTDLSAEPEETRRATVEGWTRVPARFHRKKDGTVFPVEITGRHFAWRGREVHIAALRDITERVRAEEALHQSEESMRALLNATTDFLYLIDKECNFIVLNEMAAKMTGKSVNDAIGTNLFDYVPDRKREKSPHVNEVIRTKQPLQFEDARAGRSFITSMYPILDSNGEIEFIGVFVRDITERKRAEEELREREQEFRALVENAPDVISRFDKEFRHVYVNPAVEQESGMPPEFFIGKTNREVGTPEDIVAQWHEAIRSVFETGKEKIIETQIHTPDGIRYYSNRVAPEFVEDGSVTSVLNITRNITIQKQAEEALRESEEKFRSIIEQTDDGIVLIDEQGVIIEWNQGEGRITGLTRAEVLGRPIWDVMFQLTPEEQRTPAMYEQHKARLLEFFRTGQAPWSGQLLENEIQCPDRTRRTVQQLTFPIRTDKGFMGGSISRDITERKQAEEEIRTLNQFLDSIIDNANVWLDVLDEKANVVIWNKAAEEISGYSREEVVGHGKIWEWLYPDGEYRDEITAEAAAIIEKSEVVEDFETTIRRKDCQTRVISWNSRTLVDERGNPIGSIALGRDITERVRAEEQLRATLRAKTALLQEVDHRVKNNLQVISSLLSMQASSSQDPQVIQALQVSERRVRTMAMIHERLSQSADLTSIDARQHVRTLVNNLIAAYGGWEPGIIPRVEVDEVSLDLNTAIPCSLIINELVSNALEHAFPAEGDRPRGEDEIHVELRMAGDDELRLVVSDNGVGLPPELDIEAPPSLGLQLVKLLAWQLRGTLELDRSAGTAFKITFAGPGA